MPRKAPPLQLISSRKLRIKLRIVRSALPPKEQWLASTGSWQNLALPQADGVLTLDECDGITPNDGASDRSFAWASIPRFRAVGGTSIFTFGTMDLPARWQ